MNNELQLTEAQQNIIHSYDSEIAQHQQWMNEAEAAWVNGADYEPISYHREQINRLNQWKREDLEYFAEETNEDEPAPDGIYTEEIGDFIEPGDMIAAGNWEIDALVLEVNRKYGEVKAEYALTDKRTGDPLIFRGWFDLGNVRLTLKAAAAF